jgi:hypothetical protein
VGINTQNEVDPLGEHDQGQSSARQNPGFGPLDRRAAGL